MKKNRPYRDLVVLVFFGFLSLSACGGNQSSVHSSRDNGLIRYDDRSNFEDELYRSETANLSHGPIDKDGVAFYINKNLSEEGIDQEDEKRLDFPELRSSFFESSNSVWRPRRGYDIPIVKNARVDTWIKTFTGPLRSHYTRWLGRAGKYGPIIEKILREYHLPYDLIYLAMVESGLNVSAYSRAHAAGPWQFIASTGRLYGLESGGYVDERRDLEQATRAAAAHLRDLKQQFGDWYLAFAAYNAGAGGVQRAINRGGTRDFWKLTTGKKRYLRQETVDYVPRILAAAIIAKDYKKYGFSSSVFGEETYEYDTVAVNDATDLSVVAECAGAPYDDIKLLNASLVRGITPPGQRCTLKLPKGTREEFQANYARIPASERVRVAYHKVRKNETVASIAKKYGISKQTLASANGMSINSRLKYGTQLVVPKKGGSGTLVASLKPTVSPWVNHPSKEQLVEKQSGAFDVHEESVSKVIFNSVNNLDSVETSVSEAVAEETPHIEPATYTVKKGDTIGSIAYRKGVSVRSIRAWNNLGSSNKIVSGQLINIEAPVENSHREQRASQDSVVDGENFEATSSLEKGVISETTVDSSKTPRVNSIYVVQPGDSLWQIALTSGVSVQDIIDANPSLAGGGQVKAHQKINLPSLELNSATDEIQPTVRSVAYVDHKTGSNNTKKIVHFVRKGETLWAVSVKYRVSVGQLKTWNRLTNNHVYPNQKLIIYATQAVAGKKVAAR